MLLEEEVIEMKEMFSFNTFQNLLYIAYTHENLSKDLYIKYSEDM